MIPHLSDTVRYALTFPAATENVKCIFYRKKIPFDRKSAFFGNFNGDEPSFQAEKVEVTGCSGMLHLAIFDKLRTEPGERVGNDMENKHDSPESPMSKAWTFACGLKLMLAMHLTYLTMGGWQTVTTGRRWKGKKKVFDEKKVQWSAFPQSIMQIVFT